MGASKVSLLHLFCLLGLRGGGELIRIVPRSREEEILIGPPSPPFSPARFIGFWKRGGGEGERHDRS